MSGAAATVNEPPGTAHPADPAAAPAGTEAAEREPLAVVAAVRRWAGADPEASLVCCDLTNQVRPAAAAIATTTATITHVRPVRDR
jgi:hypothetical protein